MQIAQDLTSFELNVPTELKLFKIQRTCVYDGPGIRTTLFFRGCGLKCRWCQNPEMQSFDDSIAPECNDASVDAIMEVIKRDKQYYHSTGGGVTLSGGEPLLQDPDSLLELLHLLKHEKIPVSVETTLHAPWETIQKIAPYVDLFLVDLKVIGDDVLHKTLTNQSAKLIHDNLKKLLAIKAKIKIRMVMVPGLNDSQLNIKAAADFLKSNGVNSIELLKYHNMYEEKAQKLGVEFEKLNITSEQSYESVRQGLEWFKEYGIRAENAELDFKPQKATFTQRVLDIQQAIRESPRALCFEASNLKTDYYKKFKGFEKPTPIHRAERLAYVLKNKKTIVYPKELLVGNFTSKRVAGQVWEEYYGILNALFLYRLSRQKPVKFKTTFKERMRFYFKIFPYWKNHGLIAKVFPGIKGLTEMLAHGAQAYAGFLNNMAAIAHFIVNFDRLLKLGTTGLIEEAKALQKAKPENNQDFYQGVIIALEGLEVFAQKYAESLDSMAQQETDVVCRKELEQMAEICRHVPKYPARTFHEALQCMTFLQISLCIEAYENAVSFGRIDQVLYPYYKKDLEAGRINYEQAKELLGLFVLKMDEAILVNDGDSVIRLSMLFETLSTDQIGRAHV